MDGAKKICVYEYYFSYGPLMKWIHAWTHPCTVHGQLQGIKGKNIKGGDNNVHGCTLIKEWIVTDWTGCLMNTWLGRGPNLLNPHSYSAFGFKQHNKETCFYTLYCTGFSMVKLTQKNLLKRQRLWVKERNGEGRADLQCVRQQGQPIPGEVLAF